MTQRAAFLLATALTVCVLILGAGVVVLADRRAADASSPSLADAAALSEQDSASVQEMVQVMQQRDAEYRAEIEKANTQLRQAYETIQTLQAQNQQLQERELVYQQRLGEAIQYIQFIQNQGLQLGVRPNAFADEDEDEDEHHD